MFYVIKLENLERAFEKYTFDILYIYKLFKPIAAMAYMSILSDLLSYLQSYKSKRGT